MKQHITPQQAQQITEEQFYSLFDEIVKRKDYANFHHKKLDIGKMIEILEDKTKVKVRIYPAKYGEESEKYIVKIDISVFLENLENGYLKVFSGIELCDVLWESVKYMFRGNEIDQR